MDETAIDWGVIARCEARVRHYGEARRGEVVLRSGQDPARYAAARARAFDRLTDDAMAGESARAAAYGAAVATERRRLALERPPIAELGELPADDAVAAPIAGAPELPAAPSLAATPEPPQPAPAAANASPRFIPSYLREPPAPDVVPIHVASIEHAGPDATQLPVRRAGPTLPFAESRAGEVPEAVRAASAAARAERTLDGEEDEGTEGGVDIDATAFLPRTVFEGPATPFEKKKVESAATMALDGDALRAAAATPEPWIPLEEYAAFLGELAQDPSRAGFLRAKYGIAGEDAQRALGAAFAAQFGRDPTLRARFDALVAAARIGPRR